jgi:hypothetical protein
MVVFRSNLETDRYCLVPTKDDVLLAYKSTNQWSWTGGTKWQMTVVPAFILVFLKDGGVSIYQSASPLTYLLESMCNVYWKVVQHCLIERNAQWSRTGQEMKDSDLVWPTDLLLNSPIDKFGWFLHFSRHFCSLENCEYCTHPKTNPENKKC